MTINPNHTRPKMLCWKDPFGSSVDHSCNWRYPDNIIKWSKDLRRRSAAARPLRLWVRIPPGWMFVCCECCVLSGRGLCDKLITRPEDSYRLWCVVVCDLENLKNEEAMTRVGSQRHRKKKVLSCSVQTILICNSILYSLISCNSIFL